MTPEFDLAVTDRLLSTTRAVRRRLDLEAPVDLQAVRDCLELALQAPTAGNGQTWRWIVVTDPDQRRRIAELYRAAEAGDFARSTAAAQERQDDRTARIYQQAADFAAVLEQVPVLVVPCILGRVDGRGNAAAAGFYGSILPAVWSFMLALRSRGMGSVWTTIHLREEAAVARVLGIPDDVTQVALVPVGRVRGQGFSPAPRAPLAEVAYDDVWGRPLGSSARAGRDSA